ncbi:MAG: hypothetical protein AAB289_13040, partial [Chloroflexota bacterium]
MRTPTWFRSIVVLVAAALALPVLGRPAQAAHEPLAIYEDWRSAKTIRSDRWAGRDDPAQEVERDVRGHKLLMRHRRQGVTTAGNAGFVGAFNVMSLSNPAAIDQMEVEFKIRQAVVVGCAANAFTRLRPAAISLNTFNDGSSPGLTGDHFIRVLVNREAVTGDPEGVLTVQAAVFRCIDAVCSNAISNVFNMAVGTVMVGENFTLRAVWDEPNNRFLVGIDDQPDVVLAYNPLLNQRPARVPFADVRMQSVVANCSAAPALNDAEITVGEVR